MGSDGKSSQIKYGILLYLLCHSRSSSLCSYLAKCCFCNHVSEEGKCKGHDRKTYLRCVRSRLLARQYKSNPSTISTLLKRKESIKAVMSARGVKIFFKQPTSIHWNMEKQLTGDTMTKVIICKTTRAIYADLLRQTPGTSTDKATGEPFKASLGWLENFNKSTDIYFVVRHGEAAYYLKTFAGIIGTRRIHPP